MSASVRLYKGSQRIPAHRDLSWKHYFRGVVMKDTVLWLSLGLGLFSCLFSTPSLSSIDFKTLACLFCLMAASAGFMQAGLFDRMAALMVNTSQNTRQLCLILVFGTFFASMLITNDVALIILVPMTLLAYQRIGCDPVLPVVLQTVAANAGSALLPIGNPQNLYLFSFYRMEMVDFLLAVWPVVASGGLLLLAICIFTASAGTAHLTVAAPRVHIKAAAPFAIIFLVAIGAVFNFLDYRIAFAIAAAFAVYKGKGIVQQIDYALLLTFVGFFVFVGNVSALPEAANALRGMMEHGAFPAAALSSQIISNVPAAVLLSHFTNDAAGLLAGVSAGGCGTLIASMASLISYKLYIRKCGDKWRYLAMFTAINVLFLIVMSAAWLLRSE